MRIRTALRRAMVQRSKELLVLTNRSAPLRFAGLRAYDVMRVFIRERFASVPGVRAVYLCHSLAAGECYPGLSDFDLAIVFDGTDPIAFYGRIRRVWGSLKRFLPISDLSILTVDEFDAWQTMGGGWDPLDEVRHWKLLAGDELRRGRFDGNAPGAAMDRMQWALGHFQNLLDVAIKEERPSPLMAIVARRQLHKCFWHAVLALDARYLAVPAHRARVARWIGDHGTPEPVAALQAMHAGHFLAGPVTTLRFAAAALAYRLLDESLATNPLLERTLVRPTLAGEARPLPNRAQVEERAQAMCASVLEMLGDRLESFLLSATGTARGYAIYIVLRDGLTLEELGGALRDVRAIHRVFDDPWFNEHVPAGIPTVCSRTMFRARLQTGRSSLHYFERYRRVFHGPDLYAEVTSPPERAAMPDRSAERADWRREHLLYSLHLHQIYLGRLKPALHDYVTFYLPRLMLQRATGTSPATADEAVVQYAALHAAHDAELPRRMLDAYRGKDLDLLLRTMPLATFDEVWPLLRQGLHSERGPA